MMKLFFLMVFFFAGPYLLKADEGPGGDREFMQKLASIKDPFETGFPKPVVVPKPIDVPREVFKPIKVEPPKPKVVVAPVITIPTLNLQGVIVGEGINEAIIDDQIVPLQGSVEGAKIIAVSKKGVGLLYKGQKFFLKVD